MSKTLCATLAMPRYSYVVRLHHADRPETDEYEYWDEDTARYHFDAFDESDAESYSSIELLRYDWLNHEGCLLAIIYFIADGEDEEGDDSGDVGAENTTDAEAENEYNDFPCCPLCNEKHFRCRKQRY